MRRVCTFVAASVLALGFLAGATGGRALAAAGFDSTYQFESAFLTLAPGDTGTFAAFFANTGTAAWVKGSSSQVNLAVCDTSKVFCNVPSINSAFANGWLSTIAYASHSKDVVGPGDFSPFSYNVRVPAGQPSGTYRFSGDLVLAATGERIHPEGYYQELSVQGVTTTLGVSPAFDQSDDNDTS